MSRLIKKTTDPRRRDGSNEAAESGNFPLPMPTERPLGIWMVMVSAYKGSLHVVQLRIIANIEVDKHQYRLDLGKCLDWSDVSDKHMAVQMLEKIDMTTLGVYIGGNANLAMDIAYREERHGLVFGFHGSGEKGNMIHQMRIRRLIWTIMLGIHRNPRPLERFRDHDATRIPR